VNPFETETMADLCVRQGHREEALGIYRRLLARDPDRETRVRLEARMRALQEDEDEPAAGVWTLTEPGTLAVEWRLQAAVRDPALQILILRRTPAGIVPETRTVSLDASSGRLAIPVEGLHSAVAAVGTRKGDRFVPLARSEPRAPARSSRDDSGLPANTAPRNL
jgi:hypothetical protein